MCFLYNIIMRSDTRCERGGGYGERRPASPKSRKLKDAALGMPLSTLSGVTVNIVGFKNTDFLRLGWLSLIISAETNTGGFFLRIIYR